MKSFPGLVTNFIPIPTIDQNLSKEKVILKKSLLGESVQTSSLDHLNQRHIRTSGEFLFLQFWRSVLRFYQIISQLSNRSNFLGPRPYINNNFLGQSQRPVPKISRKSVKLEQSKNFSFFFTFPKKKNKISLPILRSLNSKRNMFSLHSFRLLSFRKKTHKTKGEIFFPKSSKRKPSDRSSLQKKRDRAESAINGQHSARMLSSSFLPSKKKWPFLPSPQKWNIKTKPVDAQKLVLVTSAHASEQKNPKTDEKKPLRFTSGKTVHIKKGIQHYFFPKNTNFSHSQTAKLEIIRSEHFFVLSNSISQYIGAHPLVLANRRTKRQKKKFSNFLSSKISFPKIVARKSVYNLTLEKKKSHKISNLIVGQ